MLLILSRPSGFGSQPAPNTAPLGDIAQSGTAVPAGGVRDVLRTGSSSSVKHAASSCEDAPDGWDCARFRELVLNFGSFPVPSFFSPAAGNSHRWAVLI